MKLSLPYLPVPARRLLLAVLLSGTFATAAQAQTGVRVGTAGSPDASAVLDVNSTTQGMLVPRLTAAQRTAIATPATGLLVYQTDAPAGFYYYTGAAWTSLNSGGTATLYTADGTLSANRTVGLGGNTLDFGGAGTLGLNDNALRLRAASNGNYFLKYDTPTDGPVLAGLGGGKLGYGTGAASTALSWGSSGVGINGGTSAFTLPTGRGTSGQVLTTNGSGGTNWVTAAGGGARLELIAKKTAATQALSLANNANTGDVVVYDNVVTAPTLGSYSTSTNAYTVGTGGAGVYLVQVKFHMVETSPASNTVSAWSYVEVNGTSLSVDNVYSQYITNGGGNNNLPTGGYKGLSSATYLVNLNAGDVIRIKALGENSSVTQTLNNNGGCQLMVLKLN